MAIQEQWKPRVTVAAIIEKDNRFLIVEEDIDNRVMLNQPAGHWEDNETLIEAVIRETLEETAWHFQPTQLVGIYQWKHTSSGDTYLRFAFTGGLLSKDEHRTLDEGIIQASWYTKEELLKNQDRHRSPQLMLCINDYLSGKRFPLEMISEAT